MGFILGIKSVLSPKISHDEELLYRHHLSIKRMEEGNLKSHSCFVKEDSFHPLSATGQVGLIHLLNANGGIILIHCNTRSKEGEGSSLLAL